MQPRMATSGKRINGVLRNCKQQCSAGRWNAPNGRLKPVACVARWHRSCWLRDVSTGHVMLAYSSARAGPAC